MLTARRGDMFTLHMFSISMYNERHLNGNIYLFIFIVAMTERINSIYAYMLFIFE